MQFNQLKQGDKVYILESVGTFQKQISYSIGTVTSVSQPYDEPLPAGQFPIPGQSRKRIVDVTITCYGETRKLTVQYDKSTITDTSIGLTVSTDTKEIESLVNVKLQEAQDQKEAVKRFDQQIYTCQQILEQLKPTEGQS